MIVIGDFCFPAGTEITMADGRMKPIEAVRLGERVKGVFGVNRITGLYRSPVGAKKMFRFAPPRHAAVSDSMHPFWGRRAWAAVDPAAYHAITSKRAYPCQTARGREMIFYEGVRNLAQMRQGEMLLTESGEFQPVRFEPVKLDPGEALYSLIADGCHSMFANGIATSAWAHDHDFDYAKEQNHAFPRLGRGFALGHHPQFL